MGTEHEALSTLTLRELIDLLADTEQRIRLLRRAATSTTGHTPLGRPDGHDDGPEAVRHLLRQQNQIITELRRRRSRGTGGHLGSDTGG
ncbi:hypothetical protein [Segeticoccus rhizosphaerae]|jgi:hypothetical protein|uniref:hypothetical protein n=1 Tax=Segeticoccus rhizosphaerae TaxID=1104777 RepID=UPI0010C01212|nr:MULTISPECIES: hypothetical protein [Intrasporangiaceae]